MKVVKDNSSFYTMSMRSGKDTSVYSETTDNVYCFKTSYDLRDVFNDITKKYLSAKNWKKRFHWDRQLKMWCTQDFNSYIEAKEILNKRVRTKLIDISNNSINSSKQSEPIKEIIPIKHLSPEVYDIDTKYLHYNKTNQTLSVEISDLPDTFDIKRELIIYNPKTGNTKEFIHYKNDVDGSGEDVYGYRYKNSEGIELLIIND